MLVTRNNGREYYYPYTAGGYYLRDKSESNMDLINFPVRHNRTVWMNVYPIDGVSNPNHAHMSKEEADKCRNPNRIACLELELDFEEGEGL